MAFFFWFPLNQFDRIRRSVYHPSVIYVGRTKQSHQPCQAAGAEPRCDDTDTMVHVIAIPAAVVAALDGFLE